MLLNSITSINQNKEFSEFKLIRNENCNCKKKNDERKKQTLRLELLYLWKCENWAVECEGGQTGLNNAIQGKPLYFYIIYTYSRFVASLK